MFHIKSVQCFPWDVANSTRFECFASMHCQHGPANKVMGKKFHTANLPCSMILLHSLVISYRIKNKILNPCTPEIIPSPWLINLPHPSTIIISDENSFRIPVNVAMKIGILDDFFYPVHDQLPKDVHCSFKGPVSNCNQACFKLTSSGQLQHTEEKKKPFLPSVKVYRHS